MLDSLLGFHKGRVGPGPAGGMRSRSLRRASGAREALQLILPQGTSLGRVGLQYSQCLIDQTNFG